MPIDILSVDTDADLERLLAVRNAVDPRPVQADTWRSELGGAIATSTLLASFDGRDVGAGRVTWGAIGLANGLAFLDIWVVPDARGTGIGRRLWSALADFARDSGLQRISVAVVEGDAASQGFAERRGLTPSGGGQLGYLDLAAGHADERASLPDGITLTTLAERPELEPAVYDLDMLVRPEVPAMAGELAPSYEAWQAELTSDEGFLKALSLVALRDAAVVGVVQVYDGGGGSVFIGMTAVAPSARRIGLARALKQELARRAAANGYHRIETYNDGANDRIRGLNESFGYVYYPRMVILKGPLPDPGASSFP